MFRSNRHFYCQAINDEEGKTLASISSMEQTFREKSEGSRQEKIKALGQEMVKRLKDAGVKRVVLMNI